MGNDDTLVIIGLASLAVLAYTVFGKSGATDQASAAGKWVAQNIINPGKNAFGTNPVSMSYVQMKAIAQGYMAGGNNPYYLDTVNVPVTPTGYSDTNWSWKLKNGTVLGLPVGMTPAEFCRQNPGSPICQPGAGVI